MFYIFMKNMVQSWHRNGRRARTNRCQSVQQAVTYKHVGTRDMERPNTRTDELRSFV